MFIYHFRYFWYQTYKIAPWRIKTNSLINLSQTTAIPIQSILKPPWTRPPTEKSTISSEIRQSLRVADWVVYNYNDSVQIRSSVAIVAKTQKHSSQCSLVSIMIILVTLQTAKICSDKNLKTPILFTQGTVHIYNIHLCLSVMITRL